MDWPQERYVRLYTRDTAEWVLFSEEARLLFCELLRKANRRGVVQAGRDIHRGIAALCHLRVETVKTGLVDLLEDGCIYLDGEHVVFRNFVEAQEAKQSDAARKRLERERKRDLSQDVTDGHAESHAVTPGHTQSHGVQKNQKTGQQVTPSDTQSRSVTDCHVLSEPVTRSHTQSHGVTPSLAEPSLTKPSPLSPPPGGTPRGRTRVREDDGLLAPTTPTSEQLGGGDLESKEPTPPQPVSTQASRDLRAPTRLQAQLAKAYAEGIKLADPNAVFPPPHEPVDLSALLAMAGDKFGGNPGVFEAPAWVTESARRYRLACADRPAFELGFAPRKWAEWVKGGRDRTPIADTRRGQDGPISPVPEGLSPSHPSRRPVAEAYARLRQGDSSGLPRSTPHPLPKPPVRPASAPEVTAQGAMSNKETRQ